MNLADWHALMAEARTRVMNAKRGKPSLVTRAASVATWLALVAACVFMFSTDPPLVRPMGIGILLVAFGGAIWIQYLLQRSSYAPQERGAFLGDAQFDFDPAGFHARRSHSDAFNRWPLVTEITHTEKHVFLWIDAITGYVVPARDLPAPLTSPAAAAQLRKFIAAAPAEPAIEAGSAPPVERSSTESTSQPSLPLAGKPSVAQELQALLRLHTWGLVDGARLFGRDVTLIVLGAFSLALWVGLDRLTYDGEVELFIYGIAENAALVLATLAVAWLLSRTSRPRIELRQGLLLVLGFLPIFVILFCVAARLPKFAAIALAVLVTGWAERFFGAGLHSLTGRRQWLAVTTTLVGVLALVYLSSVVYFSPGFWIEQDEDAQQTEEAQRNREQIVFEQSARIDADISSLAPREAERPNAFFVGFAGFGAQRVFADEIGLARKRIGERFGTAQRSLLLVNDERDVLKYPLATAPSLRHALNALGRRMNLEEDVLFLALSSHGSIDGGVSIASELGYWRDLDATELADMLRESGIRWRVIVVSACYSGTFIEPLRNDNTIILTAAASDRTSFGCSDDNDLTYFGEAFYRDALPKAANLRAAFDMARAAILKRETREGMTPSNPQAYFGAAIEQKLAAIEATRTN